MPLYSELLFGEAKISENDRKELARLSIKKPRWKQIVSHYASAEVDPTTRAWALQKLIENEFDVSKSKHGLGQLLNTPQHYKKMSVTARVSSRVIHWRLSHLGNQEFDLNHFETCVKHAGSPRLALSLRLHMYTYAIRQLDDRIQRGESAQADLLARLITEKLDLCRTARHSEELTPFERFFAHQFYVSRTPNQQLKKEAQKGWETFVRQYSTNLLETDSIAHAIRKFVKGEAPLKPIQFYPATDPLPRRTGTPEGVLFVLDGNSRGGTELQPVVGKG